MTGILTEPPPFDTRSLVGDPKREKPRWPAEVAVDVAIELLETFQPACEPSYCIIAGSLRRRKETVGDIELLVVGTILGTAASMLLVLMLRDWFLANEQLTERLNIAALFTLVLIFVLLFKWN